MYYEINVSLNGVHYFATDKRSAQSTLQAKELVAAFRKGFPAAEGYRIDVTKWETVGQSIDLDTIDPPTPPVVEPTLTELEARILPILRQQAEDCSGGDFGIVEQVAVSRICSRRALGAILTSLQAKGILTVWPPTETNGGPRYGGERLTQFTFDNR